MLRIVGAGHPRFFPPHPRLNMKNRFVRLVLLGVLAFSATMAEALEAWVYGVSSNSGWYDNNKDGNEDSNLCWAASAANIINWWQSYSNYTSTTAPTGTGVWQTFQNNFKNEMLEPDYAWRWFYKGSDAVKLKSGATATGGYYPEVSVSEILQTGTETVDGADMEFVYDYVFYSEKDLCKQLVGLLQDNYGVSLAIKNDYGLSHAITLWGINYNEDYSINYLYVTDSDDASLGSGARLFTLNASAYDSSLLQYDTTFVFDTYDAENELSSSSLWYKKYQLLQGGDGLSYDSSRPSYNRIDGFYAFQLVNPIDLPEPSTGVLALTGLGLLLRRRRRAA